MKKLIFLLVCGVISPLYAELNEVNQKALQETQEVLENPQKRQEVIDKDEGAKKVDSDLSTVARDQADKDAIYKLSSQLMKNITEQSKGDELEMQKIMMEAQKNPQEFYQKYMSAEQQKQVRDLATEIEKSKTPQVPQN